MSTPKTARQAWRPSMTDRTSAGWQNLMLHLADRVEDLRTLLENEQPPEVTARLRGQIAEAKRLLALDSPPPETALRPTTWSGDLGN